jgi:large subunit ribosomal protein L31
MLVAAIPFRGCVLSSGTLTRWTGSRRSGREAPADPAHLRPEERFVKKDLHPDYVETTVTCTCGNTFTTRSTSASGQIHADVCSQCHPFYTGKQKILDTGGRVARFEARYGKKAAAK